MLLLLAFAAVFVADGAFTEAPPDDGGFAEAVAELPYSIEKLQQLNGKLAKDACTGKTKTQEEIAVSNLLEACKSPAFACTTSDCAKMLDLYACAILHKSAIKGREEFTFLLSIRDKLLAPRSSPQGIIYPADNLEALGISSPTRENYAFAMVPNNVFLNHQIAAFLPADEAAYLQVEEAYLNAFSGEYTSSSDFKKPHNLARNFLKKYRTSPHQPSVQIIFEVAKARAASSGPTSAQEEAEQALNDGPDYDYLHAKGTSKETK